MSFFERQLYRLRFPDHPERYRYQGKGNITKQMRHLYASNIISRRKYR